MGKGKETLVLPKDCVRATIWYPFTTQKVENRIATMVKNMFQYFRKPSGIMRGWLIGQPRARSERGFVRSS